MFQWIGLVCEFFLMVRSFGFMAVFYRLFRIGLFRGVFSLQKKLYFSFDRTAASFHFRGIYPCLFFQHPTVVDCFYFYGRKHSHSGTGTMNSGHARRIAFIEPSGAETNVFENYMRLPLTGCLYLGTILHNAGYSVKIYNENILSRKIDPFTIKADVYCLSALTVSANRAKLLAYQIKKVYPESRVIVGGIHASLVPEDFVEVADTVVTGEAEGNIVDIIERDHEEKIIGGRPIDNIENLPLVEYSLLEGVESMAIIPVMTSRGCPFDCNFCTVTKIFGKKFRMQSAERIVREIRHALRYFTTRDIFFYDDNFTANRNRIQRLCDLIEQENLDITWTAQVRSDISRDPEMIERMEQTGCRFFFIGFESINDATLKALHKSQTKSDIENAIDIIHKKGISIHGMFMFGEDNDTRETIHETVDFALRHHIDTVQFMILTPFPGTRLYEKICGEHRLYHTRWEYFNGMFLVFQPKSISPWMLQEDVLNAYRTFYSLWRVSIEGLMLVANIVLDALVWDFKRVLRYGFFTILLRAGATFIVKRHVVNYRLYIEFLEETQKPD
ncbi:MAG: radical SAM protein [Chitinivibrionales bacterium]|nr:radical SAM protein [Chitinivibrionales bacterium]